MSDAIDLRFIGNQLRTIQAEQRTQRGEGELLRSEIGRLAGAMATRDTMLEVLRVILDRVGNFEALMEARLETLSANVATIAAAVERR